MTAFREFFLVDVDEDWDRVFGAILVGLALAVLVGLVTR